MRNNHELYLSCVNFPFQASLENYWTVSYKNGHQQRNMSTSPHFSKVSDLLNERETHALIQFWDGLMENRKLCAKIGSEILLSALTRNPSLLPKFKIFEGMDLQQVAHHKKLAAHGKYIVYTFANIISQLHDPHMARHYVVPVATNHYKRGMHAAHFQLFFTLLLAIMSKRLPAETFTDEMKDINHRGFRMVFAMFHDCLDELDLDNVLPRVEDIFEPTQDIEEVTDEIFE